MNIMQMFASELKAFSLKNWWLYLIYILMLCVIYIRQSDSLLTVTLISTGHFIADIFIMMMFTAYGVQKYKLGSLFQVVSMLLFLVLKLITAATKNEWHYLSADIIYALSAYKNFQLDVKQKKILFINPKTLFLLSLSLVFVVWLPLKYFSVIKIFTDFSQVIQTSGIFLFGIALSYTGSESKRYFFSLFSLSIMVIGSAIATYHKLSGGEMLTGLEFSYAILPLTVFLFYLKQIKRSL
jgi:hypothetical protein